tara:strand:- start:279 stop:497 length:219 start_codon:yes stop_codon:yes gene_type:complete
MNIFKKEKFIETKYEEIHIVKLNEEKIPYVIKERRIIVSWARLLYFVYSIILDSILLMGIVWAIYNHEKLGF